MSLIYRQGVVGNTRKKAAYLPTCKVTTYHINVLVSYSSCRMRRMYDSFCRSSGRELDPAVRLSSPLGTLVRVEVHTSYLPGAENLEYAL